MRFKKLRNRVSLTDVVVALLLFAHLGPSIAQPVEKSARSAAVETTGTLACAFSTNARQKARRLVERTEAFKTVQREAKQATPVGRVAYLDPIDQPALWNGKCHQHVTVYVDRLGRFERRLSFLVDLKTGNLFLQDTNGEYQALKKSTQGRADPAAGSYR
jgi:hypothetical protein